MLELQLEVVLPSSSFFQFHILILILQPGGKPTQKAFCQTAPKFMNFGESSLPALSFRNMSSATSSFLPPQKENREARLNLTFALI